MIRFILRKDLDLDKYNQCIQMAFNSRMYAFSWYLDVVCDHWGVLVQDNYERVMPLPYRKKMGVPYIVIPTWVQQLGVFSKGTISNADLQTFIAAIPKRFKKVNLSFSSGTPVDEIKVTKLLNYVLALNSSYAQLAKNYSNGRKGDLKKAKQSAIQLKSVDSAKALIKQFIDLKGNQVNLAAAEYQKLIALTTQLKQRKRIEILEAFNKSNERLGGAIFLIGDSRITYLFSVANSKGRRIHCMSLILDHMIERYSNTAQLLDFEGSIIPSLAAFFKSFGAQAEQYFHYKKWQL